MPVPYYGDFAEDAMVYIPFNTFDSNDPTASVTITNLADTDIYYHKDGSTTDYSADAATLVSIDFDSITGNHMLAVDTSENAYFSTGAEISVRMEGTTVDGGTINAFIGSFSIERAGGALALLKSINIANGAVESDLTYIHGSALTETAGQLAAGFKKLFDVATPLLVASDVMRGTDGANTTVPDAAGTAATPAEVATALTDIKLDHLINTAAAEDEVADNSVIARLAATEGDWSEFNDENHSLEAIRVRGDAEWATATGFATPTNITAGTITTISGNVDGTVAGVTPSVAGDAMNLAADAIKAVSYDESTAFPLKSDDAGATQIARVGADGDTLETISDQIDLQALATELAKVPKSDSNVTWNATALASINAEVDTALDTEIPGAPTAKSLNDYIERMKFATCNKWTIVEANGNSDIHDDDNASFSAVAAAFTTLAGTTTRLKVI